MNLIKKIVVGSLVFLTFAGAAESRTLPAMTWQPVSPPGSTSSSDPVVFLPSTLADGSTLTDFSVEFNPGTSGSYSVLTQQNTTGYPGVAYAWGGADNNGNYSGNAVEVYNYNNPPLNLSLSNSGELLVLDFDFGGALSACNGGANLTVNNLVYTSANCSSAEFAFYSSPSGNVVVCTAANANASGNGCDGFASSTSGWSQQGSTPTAAPEIDPGSTTTALTLLAGTLLVWQSGRQLKARVFRG